MPLVCVINGPTRGPPWSPARHAPTFAASPRPPASADASRPHHLHHAHAHAMAHEGVQRQLGHSTLGITSAYLQGIDNAEIIDAVHSRRAPMVPVSGSLRL